MQQSTTISPLQTFQEAFPWFDPKVNKEGLVYSFGCIKMATKAYRMALMIILKEGLSITVTLETTWINKYTFDISMKVKPVPEEYTFQDEAQDTEEYEEERAEWVGYEE